MNTGVQSRLEQSRVVTSGVTVRLETFDSGVLGRLLGVRCGPGNVGSGSGRGCLNPESR